MYESFYGLTSKPFQLNPDPHFFFGSKQHSRAKAYLDYGVSRNDGFIVITGEIGAGKTTVARGLLERLGKTDVVTGQLVTTQLDAEDTLRMVGVAFGCPVRDTPKAGLLSTLEAFLLTQATHGKRCLLVIDEAQNLSLRALEELRMLSNFQLGNQALLQSFLIGQPEFRETLRRPEMEQFRQRVAAMCHIGPLDAPETEAYIGHRLRCAGSAGEPEFEPAAYPAIHAASQGIPRRINSICDRLLLLGFMENRKRLTETDVERVVSEFAEEGRGYTRLEPSVRRTKSPDSGDVTAATGTSSRSARLPVRQPERQAIDDPGLRFQTEDRLKRIEQVLIRLELNGAQTLITLKELVDVLLAGRDEDLP